MSDYDDYFDGPGRDDDEWRPGECDHCYGETVDGPLGPIHCACAIGQGADEDDCHCGPPAGEDPEGPCPICTPEAVQ